MGKYPSHLPYLGDRYFMMGGGMETTLTFHDGVDLRHFASFDLPARPRLPRWIGNDRAGDALP